jgi:hypothetical protein
MQAFRQRQCKIAGALGTGGEDTGLGVGELGHFLIPSEKALRIMR